jgi:hypothetical protein
VDCRGLWCPRPQDIVPPTNHLALVRAASRRQRRFFHAPMLARDPTVRCEVIVGVSASPARTVGNSARLG